MSDDWGNSFFDALESHKQETATMSDYTELLADLDMWAKVQPQAAKAIRELLAKLAAAPAVPECPYPCGWENLHKIAVNRAAYFASATLGDEIPDSVRTAGIELGRYAVALSRLMLAAAGDSHE